MIIEEYISKFVENQTNGKTQRTWNMGRRYRL